MNETIVITYRDAQNGENDPANHKEQFGEKSGDRRLRMALYKAGALAQLKS